MDVLRRFIVLIGLSFFPLWLAAQDIRSGALPVGSGPGQIGLVMALNEECHGPATISPARNGSLAILDRVNGKIVVLGGASPKDILLPDDLLEPTDFIATTRGYLVVGAMGDAAVIEENGAVLARQKTEYDPAAGSPRLVATSSGRFVIENLKGNHTPISLTQGQTGLPIVKGLANADDYQRKAKGAGEITLSSSRFPTIIIKSNMRITNARPIWVDKDVGALIAVQESRQLPQENSFVRLINSDANGALISEAYLDAETFACDTARPYARLTDGRVVSLRFQTNNRMSIKVLDFTAIGSVKPIPVAEGSDAVLIASEKGALEELEKLNGSTDAVTISMSSISRSTILDRARRAMEYRWLLTPTAYSQTDVQNLCAPPDSKWTRAKILDGKEGTWRTGLPYAWGGYIADIDTFIKRLRNNSLASNVCTCRTANCVNKRATGVDCSGFVSYAWRTGNYYTTASLPNNNISTAISWSEIAPGDIVNRKSNHVRLVESVSPGPSGNIVTVLESTTLASCGGVCRRSYSQAELQAKGYKPLRRNNLRD